MDMQNLWFYQREQRKLISAYELPGDARRIPNAKPMTVALTSVVVAEDYEGWFRRDNDILVCTKSSMGEQPEVERVHFYEEEVKAGTPIKNLLADTVFLTDDYNGEDRLWIELGVTEVDTDTGEREAVVKGFQSLVTTFGAVFPAMLPYAFAASTVTGLLHKLISALENDTPVIRMPVAFYPGEENRPGRAPLQVGTYVAFKSNVDGSEYQLNQSGEVTRGGKPSAVSYAVFDIAADKRPSPKYVQSQKVATLLTQMKAGNKNSAVGTIDFLRDTLGAYTNYKKLSRYLELKTKDGRSADEDALMRSIAAIEDLKPFLPK